MKSTNLNKKLIFYIAAVVFLSIITNSVNLEKFRNENVEMKKESKVLAPKTEETKLINRQNSTLNDSNSPVPENNSYVNPIIDNIIKKDEAQFEPVVYVQSISPASKAALELQNSPDPEYAKLLSSGFETPRFVNKVFENRPVQTISPGGVNYLWKSENQLDQNIYQNVEFNRYNNRLLDTTRYNTPAHYTMDTTGNTVVHAPSNAGMHIFSPVTTTMSSVGGTFLDLEENDYLADLLTEDIDEAVVDKKIEDKLKSYYAFLDN